MENAIVPTFKITSSLFPLSEMSKVKKIENLPSILTRSFYEHTNLKNIYESVYKLAF